MSKLSRMIGHRLQHGFLFLGLSTGASKLHAFDLIRLAAELDNTPLRSGKPTYMFKGSDIDFVEDEKILAGMNMQMAVAVFDKAAFAQTPWRVWDLDHLSERLADDEMLMISRSATVMPGKTSAFFNIDQLVRQDYLDTAFTETTNKLVDEKAHTVKCQRAILGIHKVTTLLHVQTYEPNTRQSQHMSDDLAQAIMSNLGQLPIPDLITSTYSNESEISAGSHGARTFNLYYDINDHDSLHISYKIVTFKKEPVYSQLPWRPLNIWECIKKRMINEQLKGTWKSLQRIRRYKPSPV